MTERSECVCGDPNCTRWYDDAQPPGCAGQPPRGGPCRRWGRYEVDGQLYCSTHARMARRAEEVVS